LEAIDVPLGPLTALVGPNGAGKTTILKAIDLVLGDMWPSLRSFRIPQDFNGFDTSKVIEIIVEFDRPYSHPDKSGKGYMIEAFRLTCKPESQAEDLNVELEPLNEKGEVPQTIWHSSSRQYKNARPRQNPFC